jgi:4-amino-4-deoxy-L-arabinose transferase-like glycosyltransferase
LLGAFALRVFRLDGQSLWWDEGISLHLAMSPLADLLADRLDNIHPPLYFLLLKGWLALTGVSVFTARYFSVLASWLQVAMIYAVARRWLARETAILAAVLGGVSAVSVIYGQEVRVYALLPLVYLGLLGVSRELTRPRAAGVQRWGAWAVFVSLAWAGLHLHYISFFAVAYVSLWALVVFARGRRWRELWTLLAVEGVVLLASLPWFWAVLGNWGAVQGEASAGTFVTEVAPALFLLGQVWGFHLTGLAGALGRPWLLGLIAAAAVLLAFLVAWRLAEKETRGKTAVLLAQWLLPLGSALVVWLVRSFSHPRYVAMFVPGLLLLVAYVAWPAAMKKDRLVVKGLGGLLMTAVLVSSFAGLWLYFFDPGVAKDDVRGAAQYVESVAGADDLVLVPDTDWSLPFEYNGPAPVAMPGWEGHEDGWANLARLTDGVERVFVLDYPRGTRDWQGRLPFALEAAGALEAEQAFAGVTVRTYALERPIAEPVLSPVTADFGDLQLTGAWVEQGAAAGGPLALALEWQPHAVGDLARTHVALRLLGQGGWQLSTADALLLDENGRPSGQWSWGGAPARPIVTYHLLDIPVGTPPLAYDIGVQLYEPDGGAIRVLELRDEQGAPQGQEALLPGVQTARRGMVNGTAASRLPVPLLPKPVAVAEGLDLLGASVPVGEIAAGQPLAVELLWQGHGGLADLRPEILLSQDGDVLVVDNEGPVNGRYPTDQWKPGELVWEQRRLTVPPETAGPVELRMRLGDHDQLLGEVESIAQERVVTLPQEMWPVDAPFGNVARLAGFTTVSSAYADRPLNLTLAWEALESSGSESYVVFTHLVAPDGRIIAQHDGVPAQGTRPTKGWVPGEYVLDEHALTFRDPTYGGPAKIHVGLYDPQSGVRLLLPDDADTFILPRTIDILR